MPPSPIPRVEAAPSSDETEHVQRRVAQRPPNFPPRVRAHFAPGRRDRFSQNAKATLPLQSPAQRNLLACKEAFVETSCSLEGVPCAEHEAAEREARES